MLEENRDILMKTMVPIPISKPLFSQIVFTSK